MPWYDIYREARRNEHFPSDTEALSWDVVRVERQQRLRLEALEVASHPEQAVRLTVHVGKGAIRVGEESERGITIWLSEAGETVDATVDSPEGLLTVDHAWLEPAGGGNPATVSSGTPFSAMLLEQRGSRRIYRCNNGLLEEGFDKLVFAVELLGEETKAMT